MWYRLRLRCVIPGTGTNVQRTLNTSPIYDLLTFNLIFKTHLLRPWFLLSFFLYASELFYWQMSNIPKGIHWRGRRILTRDSLESLIAACSHRSVLLIFTTSQRASPRRIIARGYSNYAEDLRARHAISLNGSSLESAKSYQTTLHISLACLLFADIYSQTHTCLYTHLFRKWLLSTT